MSHWSAHLYVDVEPLAMIPGGRFEPTPRFDLLCVSPRRFAEVVQELYLEGSLHWDEYQAVGFPSELHPCYNRTIGALTGRHADPDRPRNMLAELEKRLEFMRRFNDRNVSGAERALDVLRRVGR